MAEIEVGRDMILTYKLEVINAALQEITSLCRNENS